MLDDSDTVIVNGQHQHYRHQHAHGALQILKYTPCLHRLTAIPRFELDYWIELGYWQSSCIGHPASSTILPLVYVQTGLGVVPFDPLVKANDYRRQSEVDVLQ